MRHTKWAVHRARTKSWSGEGPDLEQRFKVMGIIKKHFGIITLSSVIIEIPKGGYAPYRRPDLATKDKRLVFELDGFGSSSKHGLGDEITKSEKDTRKDHDYNLAKVMVYRINSEVTEGYDEGLVVQELIRQGLKK